MADLNDKPETKPKRRVGRPAVYKFAKLEVGDTFTVSADDRHLARAAATTHKKRHAGWNYRSEKLKEMQGAVRFTRTA